jgi:hypothetical protein
MAISLTNLGTASGTTAVNATVPAGSLIVACVANTSSGTASVTDLAGNTYFALSQSLGVRIIGIYYAWNCLPLSAQNITYNDTGAGSGVISAFYATGIQTASNPLDLESGNFSGSSTAPSANVTSSAAGDLFVAIVGTDGPSSDTFTQDSAHAAWATPPVRIGIAGLTLAGATFVKPAAGNLIYAPTLGTSRSWLSHMGCFKAAPSNNSGSFLPFF